MIDGAVSSNGAVRMYKGIPYARPPVGDLRWRAPEPAEPWTGVRKTAASAPICMQADQPPGNSLFKTLFFTPAGPKSEDCLYLNIWTTATPGGPQQPVMVWIPGGGFRAGSASGPIYDGEGLARRGVIVVSINYRLGKLGFLAHPWLTAESGRHASGNYGLMDQIAALQWVRRNIGAFGGDPAQVTIFGQSAGSYSVNYLVASPLAKGLFARAIGESGAAFAPATVGSIMGHTLRPLADAEKGGQRLADAITTTSPASLPPRRMSNSPSISAPMPASIMARSSLMSSATSIQRPGPGAKTIISSPRSSRATGSTSRRPEIRTETIFPIGPRSIQKSRRRCNLERPRPWARLTTGGFTILG
jgi:para-nitrobenzyl esterase